MSLLAEVQHDFVHALMQDRAPATRFTGMVSPADALAIHRGAILGALVNALRLSCPTVDALVGEEFFDHAARIFAQANPPCTASLAAYGEGFADFLAGFAPAAALAYLPDVARLDRAIEAALRAPCASRRFSLDAAVCIALPQSMAVLRLDYPADEIRAALGDDAAMAAIVLQPQERFVLVWRKGLDAAVRRVDAPAGRFLAALLTDQGADAAFAATGTSQDDALCAIQRDIFAAAFCTIISDPKEISP